MRKSIYVSFVFLLLFILTLVPSINAYGASDNVVIPLTLNKWKSTNFIEPEIMPLGSSSPITGKINSDKSLELTVSDDIGNGQWPYAYYELTINVNKTKYFQYDLSTEIPNQGTWKIYFIPKDTNGEFTFSLDYDVTTFIAPDGITSILDREKSYIALSDLENFISKADKSGNITFQIWVQPCSIDGFAGTEDSNAIIKLYSLAFTTDYNTAPTQEPAVTATKPSKTESSSTATTQGNKETPKVTSPALNSATASPATSPSVSNTSTVVPAVTSQPNIDTDSPSTGTSAEPGNPLLFIIIGIIIVICAGAGTFILISKKRLNK